MEYGLAALAVVQHLIRTLVGKGVLSESEANGVYAQSAALMIEGLEGRERTPDLNEAIRLLEDLANSAPSQPSP